MEFECENMTAFGCEARDYAKGLLLLEFIENGFEIDLNAICKKQCCIGCEESCSVRCGRIMGKKDEDSATDEVVGEINLFDFL